MDKLTSFYEYLIGEEAYNASSLNCYALRQGTEPLIDYALLEDAHINLLGKELSFNQYVKAA